MDQLKNVLSFVMTLGEAIDISLADGKITLADAINFFNVLKVAGPAFQNFDELKKELDSLDEAKSKELQAFVKENFDLAEDNIEAAVEQGLAVISSLYLFLKGLKK